MHADAHCMDPMNPKQNCSKTNHFNKYLMTVACRINAAECGESISSTDL